MPKPIVWPLRILLVEDYEPDAVIVRTTLDNINADNYILTHVVRVSEAVDLLRKGGVDLVLLDLNLPDSSGSATADLVIETAPRVPVVVVSSLDKLEIAALTIQLGAVGYLVKGFFDTHLLERTILYAIEVMRLRNALYDKQVQEINRLKGLLPFCPYCGKIKDTSTNKWYSPEEYLEMHAAIDATHGICEDCRMEQVISMVQQDTNLNAVTREQVVRFLKGEQKE